MRREELITSINKILNAATDTNVLETVRSIYRSGATSGTKVDPTMIVESLQNFAIKASTFNATENYILSILGIQGITNPKFWAQILSQNEKGNHREDAYLIYRGLDLLQEYLPKILNLLKRDYEKEEPQKSSNKKNNIITVVLPEDNLVSNPKRLSNVLDAMNDFYEVYSTIYNTNKNDLGVLNLDSGSDKSFDFIGAAKVMESIRQLIVELWDRVVFYRERKNSEKLELMAKSLPIIDQIGELEKDGKLGPEQCELLRRQILSGVTKFINAGAVLPEFSTNTNHNPRLLMKPEPKLLSSKTEHSQKEKSNSEISDEIEVAIVDEELTDEEKEKLEKFYKNLKKKKKN